MNSDHIRVASLQYYMRPVRSFDQFKDQVEALVETAEDYKCQLMVFPEYFTAQLLTLGDIQTADGASRSATLAQQTPRFMELMSEPGGEVPAAHRGRHHTGDGGRHR